MTDEDVRADYGWCELCLERAEQYVEAVGNYSTDLGVFQLCEKHRFLAENDQYYSIIPEV